MSFALGIILLILGIAISVALHEAGHLPVSYTHLRAHETM